MCKIYFVKELIIINRLKELRKSQNLNMREVAQQLNIPYTTYVNYEKGAREPNSEMLILMANFYDVSLDYLIGRETNQNISEYENIIPLPKMNKVPLLGTIACGEPILADENIECDVDIPEHIKADFALRCKGDSMTDVHINDGDIVYIRQQPTVDNGQIAAVLIGESATLKKVYRSENTLTLIACNSAYEPFVYSGTELEEIKILGKAVAYTSKIK